MSSGSKWNGVVEAAALMNKADSIRTSFLAFQPAAQLDYIRQQSIQQFAKARVLILRPLQQHAKGHLVHAFEHLIRLEHPARNIEESPARCRRRSGNKTVFGMVGKLVRQVCQRVGLDHRQRTQIVLERQEDLVERILVPNGINSEQSISGGYSPRIFSFARCHEAAQTFRWSRQNARAYDGIL